MQLGSSSKRTPTPETRKVCILRVTAVRKAAKPGGELLMLPLMFTCAHALTKIIQQLQKNKRKSLDSLWSSLRAQCCSWYFYILTPLPLPKSNSGNLAILLCSPKETGNNLYFNNSFPREHWESKLKRKHFCFEVFQLSLKQAWTDEISHWGREALAAMLDNLSSIALTHRSMERVNYRRLTSDLQKLYAVKN